MYGKTCNLHSSPALDTAEALLDSTSTACDGLHNHIKTFYPGMFLSEVIKEKATAR